VFIGFSTFNSLEAPSRRARGRGQKKQRYNELKGEQAMSRTETNTGIPPELAAALDAALRNAMSGKQDPEAMQQACDEQDRLREELRQKVGELNLAVELVREARDDT
jgi:hypothetical protein